MDSWRTWELVLPALERRFDVLAPTLPGHAGGPPLPEQLTETSMADFVERAMDAAGFATARIAGNSLGGFVALQLAERGRASAVVAFAPAGGWTETPHDLFAMQRELHRGSATAAGAADAIAATPEGRRRATKLVTENYEHIPPELVAQQILAGGRCDAESLIDYAEREPWTLDPAQVGCPLRIVWGEHDRILPWPDAAERYRRWF